MKIALQLHLHQPWRLARFRYQDVGRGKPYFDLPRNAEIFRGIAERSYRPALDRLGALLDERPEFRFSLSISGTFLEQAKLAAPDVVDRLKAVVRTGRVALTGESYYHSLAFLLPPPELGEEVARHVRAMRETFQVRPKVLRMTELVYFDDLAPFAASAGFSGMLAEGWEGALGGRSPNHVYSTADPAVRLLLRNYRLSDDIGFRFSARGWSEYPLTAEKYARWLARTPGEVLGLFLDFETFGEHHPAESGILDFLSALPAAVRKESHLEWATIEDGVALEPVAPLHVARPMSWADERRDLGAWLGNDMQKSAFEAARKAGQIVRSANAAPLLEDWRKLLTSDHFYYMYVDGSASDADVHQHFSSYTNPYDAYANYMNSLNDLRRRAVPPAGRPSLAEAV